MGSLDYRAWLEASLRTGIQNRYPLQLGRGEKFLVGTDKNRDVDSRRTLQCYVSSQLNRIERTQGVAIHEHRSNVQYEISDHLGDKPALDVAFEHLQQLSGDLRWNLSTSFPSPYRRSQFDLSQRENGQAAFA